MEDTKMEDSKVNVTQSATPDSKPASLQNQFDEDDIDNDTPTFNSGELNNDVPREQTLLGPLQETSSEDLMSIIYSEFKTPSTTSKPNPSPSSADSSQFLHAKRPPTCNSCTSASLVSACDGGGKIVDGNDGFAVTSEDGMTRHITVEEAQRMVTCRCGENCACSGCLVHPRDVMRNTMDPYAGFEGLLEGVELGRSSFDSNSRQAVITDDDGVLLCGCGCTKHNEDCSCIDNMCEDYMPKHP